MAAEIFDEAVSARAQRFAARLRGDSVPSFGDLVDPPAWNVAAEDQHNDLVAVLALLHARPAIDAELNGGRLATLAQFVGEDRFDRVCEADLKQLGREICTAHLPTPIELVEQGEQLIEEAQCRPEVAHLAKLAADILTDSAAMEPAE